ncbi:hypothetical protein KAJ87_00580 [Candidatus Pacearchaeota archaeon]|nr:hypothetical protein [Candidatus Pacearchaeota archaeon]
MSSKTNEQIGNNNFNQQIEIFKEDLGIIDEIYKEVLKKSKLEISDIDKRDFIEVNKKIELNISEEKDRKEIKELIEFVYEKISLIEKTFSDLDKGDQREISIDIKEQYSERFKKFEGNVSNALRDLFKHYTPKEKTKNPKYNNLARAFVLFFFDDCTIGRENNDNSK